VVGEEREGWQDLVSKNSEYQENTRRADRHVAMMLVRATVGLCLMWGKVDWRCRTLGTRESRDRAKVDEMCHQIIIH